MSLLTDAIFPIWSEVKVLFGPVIRPEVFNLDAVTTTSSISDLLTINLSLSVSPSSKNTLSRVAFPPVDSTITV